MLLLLLLLLRLLLLLLLLLLLSWLSLLLLSLLILPLLYPLAMPNRADQGLAERVLRGCRAVLEEVPGQPS